MEESMFAKEYRIGAGTIHKAALDNGILIVKWWEAKKDNVWQKSKQQSIKGLWRRRARCKAKNGTRSR